MEVTTAVGCLYHEPYSDDDHDIFTVTMKKITKWHSEGAKQILPRKCRVPCQIPTSVFLP